MPILRAGAQLIYYAHVPKCGGSAVEHYLMDRFGTVAFNDSTYMSLPAAQRWSKTSPQHIDATSLGRLFPADFFDQAFTVVRHPVARVVSAYHFQKETERSIPEDLEFAAWLEDLIVRMEEEPFVFDNHTRPMAQIVPEGAEVFYLEHGLDAMVPWLDQVTGTRAEPRALKRINERGAGGAKVQPSPQDLSVITEIYAEDFTRFGYDRDEKLPKAPAPELPADVLEAQAAEARRANNPVTKAKSVLKRVLKGRS